MLWAVMVPCAVAFVAIPYFGRLSDRVGRKPVIYAGIAAEAVLAFPFFWLLDTGSAPLVFVAYALMMLAFSANYGPIATFLAELFGTHVRYSGLSVAYMLSGLPGSAATPAITAWLLTATGNSSSIAWYVPAAPGQSTGTFADDVRATLRHLEAVLHAAGSDLEHVLKVHTFLSSPEQLAPYNEVYEMYFAGRRAARTTVCVGLWGVSLEIDCVAVVRTEGGAVCVTTADQLALGQAELLDRLKRVDLPALGHLLEEGFVDPAVRRLGQPCRMAGTAATLAPELTRAARLSEARS